MSVRPFLRVCSTPSVSRLPKHPPLPSSSLWPAPMPPPEEVEAPPPCDQEKAQEKFVPTTPDDDAAAAQDSPVPAWWRRLVILALRCHRRDFPLWPARNALEKLRILTVQRAIMSLDCTLRLADSDASKEAFYVFFTRMLNERREDPRFHAACEAAMKRELLAVHGMPVFLLEEIEGQGAHSIVRQLRWSLRDQKSPLPYWLTE